MNETNIQDTIEVDESEEFGENVVSEDINMTFKCYENFTIYYPRYHRAKFWIEGVILIIVGILGLLGNVLTLVVLSSKRSKRTTFNQVCIPYPVNMLYLPLRRQSLSNTKLWNIFQLQASTF